MNCAFEYNLLQGGDGMRRRRPYYCGRINPALVAAIVLTVVLFVVIGYFILPVIGNTAEMQAKTMATKMINTAVQLALEENDIRYETLAVVTRNDGGEVTSIQTNMAQINAISNKITAKVIEQTEMMLHQKVSIPLGTLLGSRLFSGRGPDITFHVVPTGSVEFNIRNEFCSAGINQTLHQILLENSIGIMGVLPGYRIKTNITNQICLAETIIVGAVPEYFTQIDGVEKDYEDYIADYGPGQINIDIP